MSLSNPYNKLYFQPLQQNLHLQLDAVVKLLNELSEADLSFLVLWGQNFHQVYHKSSGSNEYIIPNAKIFEAKFGQLPREAFYVPNSKHHTLLQAVPFFKNLPEYPQLMVIPLEDENGKTIGITGIGYKEQHTFPFENTVKQLDSVATHIENIYANLLRQQPANQVNAFNIEKLPANFFMMELDIQESLIQCDFSKFLMRKHPAFQQKDLSKIELVEQVIKMKLSDFYEMVNKMNEDQSIEYIYPYLYKNEEKRYFLLKINVSKLHNGHFQCMGLLEDISIHRAYESILDQMMFDISHVMRRPVATMKGLTNLIDMDKCNAAELKDIASKIKLVSNEMEDYIRSMFKMYEAKHDHIGRVL